MLASHCFYFYHVIAFQLKATLLPLYSLYYFLTFGICFSLPHWLQLSHHDVFLSQPGPSGYSWFSSTHIKLCPDLFISVLFQRRKSTLFGERFVFFPIPCPEINRSEPWEMWLISQRIWEDSKFSIFFCFKYIGVWQLR